MIRYSKGKYKWNRKATFGVDFSLSKVIHSYLVLLKNQLENSDDYGIPRYYYKKQAEIQNLDAEAIWRNGDDESLDMDAAHELRMKDLNELIWAFDPKSEPNIKDYDFTYVFGDDGIYCTNEAASDQYTHDRKAWWNRKKAATRLFGEVYNTLDW